MRESGGRGTSRVEVTNVSATGVWLLLDGNEHFLPYAEFPWFREATITEVLRVTRPSANHLRWPDLDIDLAVESICHPERYPLISRDRPRAQTLSTPARAKKAAKRSPSR